MNEQEVFQKLLKAVRTYMDAYGPGHSSTDVTPFYDLKIELNKATDLLDTTLSAPEPDAMEMVRQVREGDGYIDVNGDFEGTGFKLGDATAAALIADFGKRVPRVIDIAGSCLGCKEWDTEKRFCKSGHPWNPYGQSCMQEEHKERSRFYDDSGKPHKHNVKTEE